MIDALVKSRFKHVKALLWYGTNIRRGEFADWAGADDVFRIGPNGGADGRVWLESYGGSRYLFCERKLFHRVAKRKLAGR